jgi:hypothetical protein
VAGIKELGIILESHPLDLYFGKLPHVFVLLKSVKLLLQYRSNSLAGETKPRKAQNRKGLSTLLSPDRKGKGILVPSAGHKTTHYTLINVRSDHDNKTKRA